MKKKVFRKNFKIQRTAMHMGTPALFDMANYQYKIVGKNIIKESIWIQEDYNNTATYVPINELRILINKTIEVIQKNPRLVKKIHKLTIKNCDIYTKCGKKILKMDLNKLSNKKLSDIFYKFDNLNKLHHGPSIATTWFVDSDGEDFSKLLFKKTEELLKNSRLNMAVANVFSILTTPHKSSLEVLEEIESLKIANEIKKDNLAKKVFTINKPEEIEKKLNQINKKLRNKIDNHYKKWNWLPYTYIGPSYDLEYYLTAWSGLIKENLNISSHLKKLQNQAQLANTKKKNLFNKLKISKSDKNLFDIASEVIYLKSYRKSAMFYGCYVLEKLHKAIAKRLDLTLKQIRFMGWWEIAPALKNGKFSKKILDERIKFSVYYQNEKINNIYHGQIARKFLKKFKFEKEVIKDVKEFTGTPACPGFSKNKVKIINTPEEMPKMRKGEIMIAHTTFPALLPAMKLASAIVTDDGGITCHAAIVARELKIPCIVGTKIATKILKDNDIIEVDANKGIIKRL